MGTYKTFKEEEGDKMKEGVGQILQEDSASTFVVNIYKPFEDLVLKKERPISNGPG
jgi:hypothetical protein